MNFTSTFIKTMVHRCWDVIEDAPIYESVDFAVHVQSIVKKKI